jgi:hypothetical protein
MLPNARLTIRATVDQPQRFVHSRAVGAHVGLTPKRYQSGETDYDGRVSKCGDASISSEEPPHVLVAAMEGARDLVSPGSEPGRGTPATRPPHDRRPF